MTRRDGMYYFRIESTDLVQRLETALLSNASDARALDELFRHAHTLKGAARAVQSDLVGDLAHSMEDVLAHHRETGEPLEPIEVGEMLALLDAIRRDLAKDGDAPKDAPEPARRSEALRIELDDMESLAGGLHEVEAQAGEVRAAVATAAELRALAQKLAHLATNLGDGLASPRLRAGLDELAASLSDHTRTLRTASDRMDVELRETTQRAFAMRLVALDEVVPELERVTHDAAAATGRAVRLEARGTDIRIDAQVLAPLRGALVHLVRNAIAHGIETPSERRALGKDETGVVTLRIERRGGRVGIVVRDDGRGLDKEAIVAAARVRGIATEADVADAEALIFAPGLSTARDVTDLAGRGVGLDAVRDAIGACKGTLRVSTRDGHGTTFEVDVPVSLTSTRALVVEGAERTVLIPIDFVRATRRVSTDDIVSEGRGTALVHDGRTIPFRTLEQILGATPDVDAPRVAVILATSRGEIALGVARLHGTREVVLRPLPSALGRHRQFSGASFDRGGVPRLVLDPEGVFVDTSGSIVRRKETTRGKPVLVIDDSLTTRMLEQSILEAVGYEVDVASSAEDGLRMASAREYGLFVCDVEMPGMNGYEFTKETRSRPELAKVPVIMVTSLDSAESRRKGAEAGVSTYIVKSEFDQSTFLRAVAELRV